MPTSEFVRELFSNGKITIPQELRRLYQIKDGDLVTVKIVEVIRNAPTAPASTRSAPSDAPLPVARPSSDAAGDVR